MRRSKAISAVMVAAALTLAGCSGFKINPKETEYYPKIGGNTFDLHNDLATILPVAERINISYEFEQTAESEDYLDEEGIYEGPLWWYRERSAANPEQFLAIHLLNIDPEFEEAPGELVKLSRTSFNSQAYCFDISRDEIPPEIQPYIQSLLDQDYPISTDLYIRRFILRDAREDEERVQIGDREGAQRTDLIYIRDVVRLGYTCDLLGDVITPAPQNEEIVESLRQDAQASFELMS
jgi:hypothetical protein